MSVRIRRSVKVAPGVRLNVSKNSVGVSAGTKGARVTVNSSGRVTKSVGIPGTGISNVETTTVDNLLSETNSTNNSEDYVTPSKVKKQKKPTVWLVFAIIFFLSTISGLINENYVGGIGCLAIGLVLLCVYRKKKRNSCYGLKENSGEGSKESIVDATTEDYTSRSSKQM